jgi:hypothetical protein
MGGIFDLFLSIETSSMQSNPIPFEHHFEMVRIGEDLTRYIGIGGRNGIAIGLKLDKTGFADGGQDDPIRAVGNGGEGLELLFLECLKGRLLGGTMDPLIPLDPPKADFAV